MEALEIVIDVSEHIDIISLLDTNLLKKGSFPVIVRGLNKIFNQMIKTFA